MWHASPLLVAGPSRLAGWRCPKRLDRRPLRPKALNMASPPSAMMMQNCWSMLELPRDEEGGTIDLADVQAAALQHAHNVEMQMGDPTVHRGALFAAGNDRTVDPSRGRRCLRSIAESNDLEHDELPGAPLRSSYMHMRMGMRLYPLELPAADPPRPALNGIKPRMASWPPAGCGTMIAVASKAAVRMPRVMSL